jgi:hypothetical protein
MSPSVPFSWRLRLIVGSLAILTAAGLGLRLKYRGAPPESEESGSSAQLAKGPDGKPALRFTNEQCEALGLKITPAGLERLADAVALHGTVQDPLPLLDLENQARSAEATLAALKERASGAQAELTRIEALHAADRGASDKALQEARSASALAASERLAAEGAARKARAAWAQTGLRGTDGLADFRRVLVRLDLPLGHPLPSPLPGSLSASASGVGSNLRLDIVGIAPGGSPATGGLAFLALASGRGLRPGLPMDARLPSQSAFRVVVPRAAVLWAGSQAQVVVEAGPGVYQIRDVEVAFPAGEDRLALATGLGRGERVVVEGAMAVQGEFARLGEGARAEGE